MIQQKSTQTLISLCTIDFLQANLKVPDKCLGIIRIILLRGIKSGWVQRQIKKINQEQIDLRLATYAHVVARFYQSEYERWLYLQRKDLQTQEALVALLNHNVSALINMYHYHQSVSIDDAVNWAYLGIEKRLQLYAFDMPLETWINRFSRQAIEYIRKSNGWYTNQDKMKLISLDELHENADEGNLPLDLSISDLYDQSEKVVFLQQQIKNLTREQKKLIDLWLSGFTNEEIAKVLSISSRAVYGRLGTILGRLADDIHVEDWL